MTEEALKKKAHDYVMNHYDSECYGVNDGRREEAAYIAGYKAAMQRVFDTIEWMKDDIIENNLREVTAIAALCEVLDYLELSEEEAKECMEEMSDDVTLID